MSDEDSKPVTSDDEEELRLAPDVYRRLIAQKRRRLAYEAGVYELAAEEGFYCTECDWRALSAPANLDGMVKDDEPMTVCPECGAAAETGDADSEEFLDLFRPAPGAPDYFPPYARDE